MSSCLQGSGKKVLKFCPSQSALISLALCSPGCSARTSTHTLNSSDSSALIIQCKLQRADLQMYFWKSRVELSFTFKLQKSKSHRKKGWKSQKPMVLYWESHPKCDLVCFSESAADGERMCNRILLHKGVLSSFGLSEFPEGCSAGTRIWRQTCSSGR